MKAFATLDGHGLKLLRQAGIEPLVITGRDSPAVRRRVADLGLQHAVYGAHDKLAAAQQLLQTLQLGWPQLAVIGDDWPDLPLLTRAGLPAPRPMPRRGQSRRPPRHRTAGRSWRSPRVLRPAADGRRPLRRAAARPSADAGRRLTTRPRLR